jgi:hypothetical protein
MAFRVSQLGGDIQTMQIKVGDGPEDVVNIKYRPGAYTLQVSDELKALRNEEFQADAAAILLLPVLVEWDILDDEGNPLPIDRAGLAQVPLAFLSKIIDGMGDDLRPASAEGKDSSEPSRPVVVQVSSPTGT